MLSVRTIFHSAAACDLSTGSCPISLNDRNATRAAHASRSYLCHDGETLVRQKDVAGVHEANVGERLDVVAAGDAERRLLRHEARLNARFPPKPHFSKIQTSTTTTHFLLMTTLVKS